MQEENVSKRVGDCSVEFTIDPEEGVVKKIMASASNEKDEM